MTGARVRRKPTFLWQAILILLPVTVLSGVGVLLVRQDKVLVRHDAVQRAQAVADELVPRIWTELTSTNVPGHFQRHSFQVDDAGQLIFPSPYTPLPLPKPFDRLQLNPEQTRLWLALQRDDPGQNPETLVQTTREFLATDPPEDFAAAAQFSLGVLLIRQGKPIEAATALDSVLERYPDAVGESGLPLRPLAQFKLLRIADQISASSNSTPLLKRAGSADSFSSNIVCQPTPLTPYFLHELARRAEQSAANQKEEIAASRKWQDVWARYETSRELFATARPLFHPRNESSPPRLFALAAAAGATLDENRRSFGPELVAAENDSSNAIAPRLLWFNTPMPLDGAAENSASNAVIDYKWYRVTSGGVPDWNWLAVRFDEDKTNHWFICHSESELGARLSEIVRETKAIPEFLGVSLEIAGRKLYAFAPDLRVWSIVRHGGKEGSNEKVYDRSTGEMLSSASRVDGGVETLKVSVFLTSPATLYQHQVARAFWFGVLVFVSTIGALTGLFAAWRAFRRQELLVEMKSNFVSSVSHELRAPIASVRLLAESLERGKIADAPRQNEYFRFIVQECRRLSSLIENVLDFSRIEQGRKQYEFEPTDLAALSRETVRLLEPYAAEKGVMLKLETSNLEPRTSNLELEVDGRAIQQALVNLIDNAIKHSPKGETVVVGLEVAGKEVSGVRCQVSGDEDAAAPRSDLTPDTSHLTPSDTSQLALSVTDHGPGIPPEEHEKIFERFYRRGSELRRETQGVGIGLSIVQHIVEAHGGRVRVESDVGKGSRFTIELPVKRNHE